MSISFQETPAPLVIAWEDIFAMSFEGWDTLGVLYVLQIEQRWQNPRLSGQPQQGLQHNDPLDMA